MKLERMKEILETRRDHLISRNASKRKVLFADVKVKYYERMFRAMEERKPVVWTSWSMPSEVFYATNLVPFLPEQYSVQVLSFHEGYEYFDIGRGYGFSQEGCTSHIATIGMVKAGELPPPDLIICPSLPCDGIIAMFDVLRDIYNCPCFFLDIPHQLTDRSIEYLKTQYEELFSFIEKHTGNTLQEQTLRGLLERSQEAQEYYEKIQALRKCVPSPLGGREAISAFGILNCCEGLPETVEYFKATYDELSAMAERGEGVASPEKHRLGWFAAYPYFEMTLLDWIEKKFGGTVVVDLLNYDYISNFEIDRDMLETLAKKTFSYVPTRICGPYSDYAQQAIDICKDYRLDSFVYYTHFGCKNTCGLTRIVADEMKEHLGIPTLIVDGDALDPTVCSMPQMKSRLEDFFTMLERREGEKACR